MGEQPDRAEAERAEDERAEDERQVACESESSEWWPSGTKVGGLDDEHAGASRACNIWIERQRGARGKYGGAWHRCSGVRATDANWLSTVGGVARGAAPT